MQTKIQWKRIVLAAFLSEIGVIVTISAAMGVYRFLIAPDRTAAEYQQFSQLAGYYLAVPAAATMTFLMAFWTVRKLDSGFIANGLLVGTGATLLALGLIFGARPGDRMMYVASFVARRVAGYVGGVAVQRLKREPSYDHARQVR